ncbi:MAG TPA: PAS domain-containing sensor histidine kinase [Chloroflexota bacterium]|nr:PAS domain-containing sensor histidine kinase [Chloroflexota bacterium]
MAGRVVLDADGHEPSRLTPAFATKLWASLHPLVQWEKHFWLTTAMVVVGTFLHYFCPIPVGSANGPLQFSSQSMHRILFMVPVAYAGFIFGPRGGFLTLFVVSLVMVPKAFFMSADLSHDVVETLCTVLVSFLIVLWFNGQQREKSRRFEILSRLELARQELAFQVDVIKKNEKRLAVLHEEAVASEQKYRDLFENATVAILVQDLQGTITAANNACTPLTGYLPGVLIGTSVRRLFPSSAYSVLSSVQQAMLNGDDSVQLYDQPYDLQMVRRDGSESILSVTTRLVGENGTPRGFQHIAIDVTERRRMRDVMNYYVRQVLTAQEEERNRIARELHDDTAQSLFLLLQKIEGMTYGAQKKLPNPARRELEEVRSVALQTLGNLRRLTRDLRPQILDDLGLVAALEWLAEDMERQSGIRTKVEITGPQRPLAPEAQLLLFRITQEALSNVRRHSDASTVAAVLEFVDGKVRVSVEDDGHGFTVPSSLSDLAGKGKLGILGMSERARLLGGEITVESEPGRGTRVTAELVA